MIGRLAAALRTRWRGFWDLADPEERIQGSGEVHLDPAYNGRYTAERRLQKLASAQDDAREGETLPRGPEEP